MRRYTDTLQPYSPQQGLLFLLLVLIWGVGVVIIVLLFLARPEDQYEALAFSLESSRSLGGYLSALFQYSDDWNWITIFLLASFSIIVFCVNDLMIRGKYHQKFPSPKDSFWLSGFLWMGRMGINAMLLLIEIVVLAYLLNISIGSQRILPLQELTGRYQVLLLGTSKYLKDGVTENEYYKQRIVAVQQLYKSEKVTAIIISGDHRGNAYSEPYDMKKDLTNSGIPASMIRLDLKGYRTFDSIKRIKLKEGEPLLIVSQYFHLERALFLAKNEGINALGYAALGNMTMDMVKREMFAKTKVLLDIYILNTQAFGVQAHTRRKISIFNAHDLILLFFVLAVLAGAGRLTRNLLTF